MDPLSDLLSAVPDVLCICDSVGGVRRSSSIAQRLLGSGVAPGARLGALVHPADRDAFLAALSALTTIPAEHTCRVSGSDGVARFFTWHLARSADGTTILATARATNDRARIFEALLGGLPLAVWAVDRAGTFIFHDGHGVEMAGLKRGEILGQNLFDGRWVDPQLKKSLATGEVTQAITDIYGGQWETWYVPLRDADGSTDGAIALSWSITASKHIDLTEALTPIETMHQHELTIRELSTPIIQLWDHVLALPIVGTVDSKRTAEVMERLLAEIVRTRARYAILDLTGVDTVDTDAAGHLIALIRAIRLLGSEGIITGIHPNVANTMVALGFDLGGLVTLADLRSGLQHCMCRLSARARPAP